MKKLMALTLALLMVFTLVACGGPTGKAEKAVKNYIEAVKKLDTEKMFELTYSEDDAEYEEEEMEEDEEKLAKLFLKKVDYKIIESEEIDEETVEVTVEITNIDFEEFGEMLEEKAEEMADEVEDLSEEEQKEEAIKLIEKCLKDKDLGEETGEITVTVINDDGDWKIQENIDLTMSLLAGVLFTSFM